MVGGDENLLLRQAISQAIDREEINDAVYDGTRTTAHGHHARRASPGFEAGPLRLLHLRPGGRPGGLRRVDGSRQRARPSRSRSSSTPDAGHEPVVQIIVDNLAADRHRGRRPSPATRRRTSPSWPTAPACSAARVGSPTTRRTTTSCSTCSTQRRSAATTTASPTPSSTPSSTRRRRRSTPTSRPRCSRRPRRSSSTSDIGVVPINWYLRRLRLQPGDDRQLPADQLRSDRLGAGQLVG